MCKADINKSIGYMVYLGWNKLNSESYVFLQDVVLELENNDMSYKMTSIGEDLTDIQEDYYTGSTDENMNIVIPFPPIINTFDDMDMEQQLAKYEEWQRINSTDIRLILQNEGMEFLDLIVREQSNLDLANILNSAETKIELSSLTYFGWNKANEDEIKLIKEFSTQNKDCSYSLYIKSPFLKEDLNLQYINKTREYVFIPDAKNTISLDYHGKQLTSCLRYANDINCEDKEYEYKDI